jgi:K(+)-stimulated pyrophosphate-energized sodium pump
MDIVRDALNSEFQFFAIFFDPKYSTLELTALLAVLAVAIAGLVYAAALARQVYRADTGTPKMQAVAAAVREGADAYLLAQFRRIGPLILVITLLLALLYGGHEEAFRWGRALAFLVGALFSSLVGFVGMRLATAGNLRVASAARRSYGEAMQLGYRTGTVTGMLTDGLGLLGGTMIFLLYGDKAYEALLGFGFGGTLLALFMRVGGGIYTKAADVGADLVGKIEQGIPEDDPRNAATIADNVGDNVGDCAGMAADIFESYEVTIVAAMILGMASFGLKGVIFPLLVRGIGVVGSIISTYTVRAGPNDTSDSALKTVHRGFWIGSLISVVGFVALGVVYLRFDAAYIAAHPMVAAGFPGGEPSQLPLWATWGFAGLDLRPVVACFIGVVLAVALNKVTSYYTHTAHEPVKSLARSCQTGHATNIIRASPSATRARWRRSSSRRRADPLGALLRRRATDVRRLRRRDDRHRHADAHRQHDLDGRLRPVADNANGIGEMGYDVQAMDAAEPGSAARARQILADLDAVGNTTKAETKGIAIGSAVIAAVSLFASFIATIAVGSEELLDQMTVAQYAAEAGQHHRRGSARVHRAPPRRRGAVPLQQHVDPRRRDARRSRSSTSAGCSSATRDRRRVEEARLRPRGRHLHEDRAERARRSRAARDRRARRRRLRASARTRSVGFLAGMILVGQLLAVFMANAGGAWDNAKKLIEDGLLGGKGSEAHKAAVTGDTVGDPLKDTAGPAVNPLIKVMNMVSLLILGPVLAYNLTAPRVEGGAGVGRASSRSRPCRRRRLGRVAEQARARAARRLGEGTGDGARSEARGHRGVTHATEIPRVANESN